MVSRPHGGTLVNRLVKGARRERLLGEVSELPFIELDVEEVYDLENIATGVYSPLTGFNTSEELESILYSMRLPSDIPWTIPIILDIDERLASIVGVGDTLALRYRGNPIGLMYVEDKFKYDKDEFCGMVFKTRDRRHPGVYRIYRDKSSILIGGQIEAIDLPENKYVDYTLRPIETRVLFKERGWKTIVGFQTRNAPHLGHEYIQKTALTFVDGLFINPVVGPKKPGDFRDEVILKAYEYLTRNYYPRDTTVLSIVRYVMRYAGPREAIHHALMRKNFGCTHFTVGRDHAGVGTYYDPYEAQEIFDEFPDLGITPLFFREFFYCYRCGGMANDRVCPHPDRDRIRFSGSIIREYIVRGEEPPPEIVRPDISRLIMSVSEPFVR